MLYIIYIINIYTYILISLTTLYIYADSKYEDLSKKPSKT